jgi:hypothetical protein
MPSSAVRTFRDADDYAATIRAGTVKLTVTGRGEFNAKLTRIDLHRLWMQRFCLWMQRFSDNLPRVCDVGNLISGRTYITFRTQPGPSLVQTSVELHPSAILRQGPAPDCYQRSTGSAHFGAMSLPIEDVA